MGWASADTMDSSLDFTCLSRTSSNMCQNCTMYAKQMINKRYNKVLKALSDEAGNFDVTRAEKFEELFLDQLNKRAINNFWRTDQKLHLHLRKRIMKEKLQPKIKLNLKTSLPPNTEFSSSSSNNEKGTEEKISGEDSYETISTAPDSGVCRRFWNPSYYELPFEVETFKENIVESI